MPDYQPSHRQRPYPVSRPNTPREPGQQGRYPGRNEVAESKPYRDPRELRIRDVSPVSHRAHGSASRGAAGFNWRSVTAVAVSTALGLGCIQIANQNDFHQAGNYTKNLDLFWLGLVLVILPISLRVIMRTTARAERITLVLLLAAALYVVKVENSPYIFTYNDEYIHWLSAKHILDNDKIFQYNPLLPTASYYPGLAALTASVVRLTGLSIFVSGLTIIGVARIIIAACLYLTAEKVTGSSRAAALASIIYAANPMFLFWSAQFAYEDLGLPLAALTVWWLYKTRGSESRVAQIVTLLAIGAVTVSHHIAAFALAGILAIWYLAELVTRKPREQRRYVGAFAILAGASAATWFFLVAHPAFAYIVNDNINPALREFGMLIHGRTGRQLYSDGLAQPKWYMLLSYAAVAIILLALVPALYRAWCLIGSRSKDRSLYESVPIAVAAIIAISFPFTLLPRLTAVGSSLSARTSEYVFMGLGCTLGLLAIEPGISSLRASNWLYRALGRLFRPVDFALASWRGTLALTVMLTAIFFGEIAIGNNYFQILPPSDKGFPWVVQPDVINASIWAHEHLGANQPFATDFVDSLGLATYGDENTESEDYIFPIFFGGSLTGAPTQLIKQSGTRYVLVDWRMTYGLPTNPGDFYFSQWEPNAGRYTKPFNPEYLEKFSTYSCSRMVYHSGLVQIYDVSSIANGTCVPKLITKHSRTTHAAHGHGTSRKKGSLWDLGSSARYGQLLHAPWSRRSSNG
jgi:Dolichyl-phosphate-mannose-protein mannosyltransferase